MKTIGIAGGGISGLTAAIHLAKNGFPVKVYEKGRDVASRFTAEFQGLENWSTEEDVLALLKRIGISPDFFSRPFHEIEAIDDLEQRHTVRTDGRAGIYLVKRGREPDSIDQYLKKTALELGVEIQFGQSPEDREVQILAKGPQSVRSVAYGMRADVDHGDRVAVLLDNRIAPKCYAYLIILDGKMVLASTLMTEFDRGKDCLSATLERVKRMLGVDPKGARPLRGCFDFGLRASYVVDGRLLVGECGGFQDYLFGFGMRYALLSGHLAARSIIEGLNYDQLVQQEIEKPLRSSLVNRYVFEKLGNWGYRRLVHRWDKSDDVLGLMKKWYGWRVHKGLLLPLAVRWLDKKERPRV
jgi:flavin-dependent dehydrogenase